MHEFTGEPSKSYESHHGEMRLAFHSLDVSELQLVATNGMNTDEIHRTAILARAGNHLVLPKSPIRDIYFDNNRRYCFGCA